MKVGLIGIGDIAKKAYLPILSRVKNIELILFTRNTSVLHEISREYRVNYVESMEKLIEIVDVVFIHSATESHYKIVKNVLEKGKHVYIDKPLSYDLKESKELIELAQNRGLVLKVGFNRRYSPYIRELKNNVNTVLFQKNRVNLLGDVRQYIYDDYIHVIDTILYLLGYIQDVDVYAGKKDGRLYNIVANFKGVDNIAIGIMNRDSGMVEENLEVFKHGEKYIVENLNKKIVYKDNKIIIEKDSDWLPVLEKRGFYNIIRDFFEDIKNPTLYSRYDEILRTHEICEEIVLKVEGLEDNNTT